MGWFLQWSHRHHYAALMRLDKPIGILLLLWPTWWALWAACAGTPPWSLWLIFTLGVILMRSAGCVINDYADRNFDGHVERTKKRPLASGQVSTAEALQLFFLLLLLSASLLLFLNLSTALLAVGAVLLASVYPFMKRHTHLPQVVLGAAFSWGMPMAYMASQGQLPLEVWVLYAANLLWTVAYDTYYAMVDEADDRKIGVRSTAILFGQHARAIILALQATALLLLWWAGELLGYGMLFHISLVLALLSFIYQYLLSKQGRQGCFQAFLQNNYTGAVIFVGIFLS
jgi:4-hydroxybenzoate polyprenyltransferase